MDRPISLTLIAVVNICYGILSFCGMGFSVAQTLAMQYGLIDLGFAMPDDIPQPTLFENVRAFFSYTFSFALSAALAISGGGLLAGKPWARSVSILYAIVTPIVGVIQAGTTVIFMVWNRDDMVEMMDGAFTQSQYNQGLQMMFFMLGVMLLINIVHCLITYGVMKSDKVEDWFDQAEWDGDDGLGEAPDG